MTSTTFAVSLQRGERSWSRQRRLEIRIWSEAAPRSSRAAGERRGPVLVGVTRQSIPTEAILGSLPSEELLESLHPGGVLHYIGKITR
jgi:hypothetical protein